MNSYSSKLSITNQISSKICSTCLSTDRKVQPVKMLRGLLWRDVELNIDDEICWECEAMLKKLLNFKQQVLKAQTALKCNMIELNYKSLSKLCYETKLTYDTELYHSQIEKDEPLDFFEFNDCNEHNQNSNDHDYKDHSMNIPSENELNNEEKPVVFTITKAEPVDVKELLPRNEKKIKNNIDCKTNGILEKFSIKMMTEDEMWKSRELDKTKSWYQGSPYKCESCILGYHIKGRYTNHLDSKHNDKSAKFICNICEERFVDKKLMVAHFDRHYKRYQCKLCSVSHHQLKTMMSHYVKEHENRKYCCKICDREFNTWRALRYHRDLMHKEKPKCDKCGKVFPNHTNLKRHLVLHTDVQLHECNICHKRYKGSWGLKSHMRFHDNTTATEDAYCAECNIQFKNPFLYRSHLKKNSKHISADLKKHACPECGKRFLEKIFLKRHIDGVHLKKREHVCHICCKMYMKEYSLRQHIRHQHEGKSRPRNKQCDICNKKFTCKAFLKQHLNSHTGDRPYQCSQCAATFGYASALYMHTKLIHLKLKRGERRTDTSDTGQDKQLVYPT